MTLSSRSRSKLFHTNVPLDMGYLLCKFQVSVANSRLLGIIIIITRHQMFLFATETSIHLFSIALIIKLLPLTICVSNLVTFEQSCSKLTYDLWLSRLFMTLTFKPSSFKPFKFKNLVTFHVCCKFRKIWTIQLKLKNCFIFGQKHIFLKLQNLKIPSINLYHMNQWNRPEQMAIFGCLRMFVHVVISVNICDKVFCTFRVISPFWKG